jgi:UPF0755 protein
MLGLISLNIMTSAVDKNDITTIDFVVPKSSTYLTIANELKEQGLIKSVLGYKIYIKLNNPKTLKAGKYELSKSMNVKQIIDLFENGSNYNPNAVTLTIPEGKSMQEIAEIAASVTNNTQTDLIAVWDSKSFVNDVIDKYWFIDNTVLKSGIRHPLEGYFFTSTYELLNKDVTPEYIAYKMLDQMDVVLSKYKNDIEMRDLTVHEILDLSSIVQYESGFEKDMPDIAEVFYNRLEIGMKLQSSVTVCYALGDVAHWTECEFNSDLDSPYNTYYYKGLPIGPILNFGEEAIKAVLYPNPNDYLFFMANVCDPTDTKTYFSKTYAEHLEKVNNYLTCY